MSHYSKNSTMLQLVSCALALLLLAGVMIYQRLEAKKVHSYYETINSVVYRVEEDNVQGNQVSYRV